MKYISTRGNSESKKFSEILVSGLAEDGGLYMPEAYPEFSLEDIKSWQNLSYQEIVYNVISPFIEDEIEKSDLIKIINDSYSSFRHEEIAPIVKLSNGQHVLELFHGPTLAFKDFALQLLGNLLNYTLEKNNDKITIIGATSGDTGSAAIEGCRKSDRLKIFILHPFGKVSDVQRKQMTTINQDNVFNIALEGNFDDCQNIVKDLFNDKSFNKNKKLVAVNSINWARIMAQIVYYFSTYLKLECPEKISFSVPTGNFGDIFAGYVAKRMGLPIDRLVVATNKNDILHRFFKDNDYSKLEVSPTITPSMDIQISSNFERLLFNLHNNDGKSISTLMNSFKEFGKLKVDNEIFENSRKVFSSYRADEEEIISIISDVYKSDNYILDPHTAIGLIAANKFKSGTTPMVTLATAHPAKFPDAIKSAGLSPSENPEPLKVVFDKEEKFEKLANKNDVIDFIDNNL